MTTANNCAECGGSGAVDSGGSLPWGEWVEVCCGACSGTGKRSTDKCKHGLYIISGHSTCAVCKGWPSIERMRNMFPGMSETAFLIMTPDERLEAMKTGVIKGLQT